MKLKKKSIRYKEQERRDRNSKISDIEKETERRGVEARGLLGSCLAERTWKSYLAVEEWYNYHQQT
jgi:hypothetical protein